MDISATLVGKSDQLDNIDLLSGPRDFTITDVSAGNAEQPINITLAEFPRPWRPGLTMRRVLAAAWGPDASMYVGRRVRLYRDPQVSFGKDATGGTRLSHASHIEKRVEITLPTSRGKFGLFKVDPLPDAPTPPPIDVGSITDEAELKSLWQTRPDLHDAIKARVNELKEEQS